MLSSTARLERNSDTPAIAEFVGLIEAFLWTSVVTVAVEIPICWRPRQLFRVTVSHHGDKEEHGMKPGVKRAVWSAASAWAFCLLGVASLLGQAAAQRNDPATATRGDTYNRG